MNLQEELKLLKERIAELEEQVEQEKEFPQFGDDYWYVDNDTEVMDTASYDGEYDQGRLSIGNVFKTKEQAEFAVEKLKVEAKLRKLSDSWDLEKTQYTFTLDCEFGKFKIECPDYTQYPNSYYFDSVDSLQHAIETVGAELIKKYIFEV